MTNDKKNTIAATVHLMNANAHICIITIRDGNDLVVDNSDIGLEVNPDGTANSAWIREKISSYVSGHRKAKAMEHNSKISVLVGDEGESPS